MGPGVRRGDWWLSFEVEQFPRTAVALNGKPDLCRGNPPRPLALTKYADGASSPQSGAERPILCRVIWRPAAHAPMPKPKLLTLALLCSLLLTHCAHTPTVQPVSDQDAVPSDALRGTLLLPPGSALPPGARLRLSLIDRFGDGGELATRELVLESPTPLSFSLPFDRRRVSDVTVYRLDAAVYGPDGSLLFTSDGEHPVNLGVEAEATRIELMTIERQSRSIRSYNCDGLPLNAEFLDPDLVIEISQQQHRLRRAHAASGIRYIGANAEFWARDNIARLQLGDRSMNCALLGQ